MSNMGTLNQTTESQASDTYLVRQSGIDLKQNRATLAAALMAERYTTSYVYLVGDHVKGSNGERYRARVSNGPSTGAGLVDPVSDNGLIWTPIPLPCNNNLIPKNSKIEPTGVVSGNIAAGQEPSSSWFVGTELVNATYSNDKWNADSGTLYRDIPVKNGIQFYTDDQFVASVADESRLPSTNGVTVEYDNDATPTMLRITIDFAVASDVFSAKVELGDLPSLHNVAQVSGSGGATGGGADELFYETDQTMNSDYELSAGKNAITTDFTIADGVTLTVPDGARLVIV